MKDESRSCSSVSLPDPSPPSFQTRRRRHVRSLELFHTRSLFPRAAYLSSSDVSTVEERHSSEESARHLERLEKKSGCCFPARRHFALYSCRLVCFNDFQLQLLVIVGTTLHTPEISTARSCTCSTCSSLGPARGVNVSDSVWRAVLLSH